MTEPFVFTETDLTKSRWVARVYQDFIRSTGRTRTTLRGLFYHALHMKSSEYPICGGFVGEIRITRPYHESDGPKLLKWVNKSRSMGLIPADAILQEVDGEHIFLPQVDCKRPYSLEVWINKSSLNPLLYPICQKHCAALVSVSGRASKEAISALYQRSPRQRQTVILTLSDLSPSGAFFCKDLMAQIDGSEGICEIKLKSIGLGPEQVLHLNLPLLKAHKSIKEDQNRFKRYLKPYPIDARKMAELDCLEVHYPQGVAGFLDTTISEYLSGSDTSEPLAQGR